MKHMHWQTIILPTDTTNAQANSVHITQKTRPPNISEETMGDVAQVRDANKRCPICWYSPIIYFQPEDENAEQVEILYPFGFKGDIPLLTEVEYDEARAASRTT
eukprot:scaffold53665_cov59-Attheya_sp.AAC.12